MEPIEINAGTHYLRQFRADDRLDDRPALLSAFADPAVRAALSAATVTTSSDASAYIDARAAGWRDDDHYTWAVAELTTGTLIGEVRLEPGDSTTGATGSAGATAAAGSAGATGAEPDVPKRTAARLRVWTHPDARRQGVATTAVSTVLRFGFGALDLERVDFHCTADDVAAIALARRCGFIPGDGDQHTVTRPGP